MEPERISTSTEQVHFDVAAVPSGLDAEDGLAQNVALEAACLQHPFLQDEGERFHNQYRKRRPLSFFADVYNTKDDERARGTLTQRTEIILDGSEYVTDHADPSLAWSVDSHYLDLQICVGDGLGLAAMLPNIGTHHALEFRLELKHRTRRFQAKYAKLGFEPTNCMLWIGRSSVGEDAWLAWIPQNDIWNNDDHVGLGSGKEDTTLTAKQYRMTTMFLATMLENIGLRDIFVLDKYPDLENETDVTFATNLL